MLSFTEGVLSYTTCRLKLSNSFLALNFTVCIMIRNACSNNLYFISSSHTPTTFLYHQGLWLQKPEMDSGYSKQKINLMGAYMVVCGVDGNTWCPSSTIWQEPAEVGELKTQWSTCLRSSLSACSHWLCQHRYCGYHYPTRITAAVTSNIYLSSSLYVTLYWFTNPG